MVESSEQHTAATQQRFATRQSWANFPLPEQRALISFQRQFTQEEYEVIRYGLIPEAMEDKWFIFLEEDVLYFHRSWTGYCIYQLTLRKDGANYTVAEALTSRDVSQYSATNDEYDVRLLTSLIDNLLLGKSSTRETVVTITMRGVLGWLWAWLKFLIRG